MLYCSYCKYEYKYGISVCPDCGERLSQTPDIPASLDTTQNYPGVDDTSLEVTKPNVPDYEVPDSHLTIEWVQSACFNTEQEAEMFTEALRNSGINAILQTDPSSFVGKAGLSVSSLSGRGSYVLVEKSSLVDADLIGQAVLGDVWEKAKLFDIGE